MKESKSGLWLAMSWAWTGMALAQEVTVYKSPSCGCCTKWVRHVEASGLTVEARDVPDVNPYKQKLRLPLGFGSCHTAVVDGYLIEGHVPQRIFDGCCKSSPKLRDWRCLACPWALPVWRVHGKTCTRCC